MSLNNLPKFIQERIQELEVRISNMDFEEVHTFQFKLQEDINSYLKNLSNFQVKRFIVELKQYFNKVDFNKLEKQLTKSLEAERDELISSSDQAAKLFELISYCDDRYPFVTLILLIKLGYQRGLIEPISGFEKFDSYSVGEKRAKFAMQIFHDIYEQVYVKYLEFLWCQTRIYKGNKFSLNASTNPGNMNKNLINWYENSKYKSLFFEVAPLIRNPYAHKDYRYNPKTDELILNNDNYSQLVISVNDLFFLSKNVYELSAVTFMKVFHNYLWLDVMLKGGLYSFSHDVFESFNNKTIPKGIEETKFSKELSWLKDLEVKE